VFCASLPLKFKSTRGKMNAGLIVLRVASERRDAQNERDGAGAAQLRRRNSSVAAAAPSKQQYNLALKWNLSSHRVPRRGAAGSTSRRDATAPRGGTRAARSISSVAAASAPSPQQKQATAVSRDDGRSTGALLLKLFKDHDVHANCHHTSLSSNIPPGKSWVSLTL